MRETEELGQLDKRWVMGANENVIMPLAGATMMLINSAGPGWGSFVAFSEAAL